MSPSNKEMQQLHTCRLYSYVLAQQGKEVPEEIQDCAISYDYLLDCSADLAREIEGLDSEAFERIMHNPQSKYAKDVSNWWDMYQEADRLRKALFSDT